MAKNQTPYGLSSHRRPFQPFLRRPTSNHVKRDRERDNQPLQQNTNQHSNSKRAHATLSNILIRKHNILTKHRKFLQDLAKIIRPKAFLRDAFVFLSRQGSAIAPQAQSVYKQQKHNSQFLVLAQIQKHI